MKIGVEVWNSGPEKNLTFDISPGDIAYSLMSANHEVKMLRLGSDSFPDVDLFIYALHDDGEWDDHVFRRLESLVNKYEVICWIDCSYMWWSSSKPSRWLKYKPILDKCFAIAVESGNEAYKLLRPFLERPIFWLNFPIAKELKTISHQLWVNNEDRDGVVMGTGGIGYNGYSPILAASFNRDFRLIALSASWFSDGISEQMYKDFGAEIKFPEGLNPTIAFIEELAKYKCGIHLYSYLKGGRYPLVFALAGTPLIGSMNAWNNTKLFPDITVINNYDSLAIRNKIDWLMKYPNELKKCRDFAWKSLDLYTYEETAKRFFSSIKIAQSGDKDFICE